MMKFHCGRTNNFKNFEGSSIFGVQLEGRALSEVRVQTLGRERSDTW